MKDSGIPWLGAIPEGWKIMRVKQHYPFTTGFTPESKNESFYDDNGTEWVTIGDLNGRLVKHSNKGISKLYIEKYKPAIIPAGSLLYSFKLSVGQVAITDRELFTNEAIAAFSNLSDDETRFLYYSAQVCIVHNANENIYGAKLLNQDLINNAKIIFPPLWEQKLIADYLDRKCGEIDELVVLQEKMIEELKSYKQSVITEAVTKGLNPDAPMKDSGIEWIGEIPEGWELKKLKNTCNLFGRIGFRGYTTDDLVSEGEGAITLSPTNINGMKLDFSHCSYLSWNKYYESPEIMVNNGDVILVKTASVGKCCYVDSLPLETTVNPQILVLKNHVEHPKFLAYIFQTPIGQYYIDTTKGGSTVFTISQEKIGNYIFAYPPRSEQQAIADYLDEKCAEIDSLITLKQQKIEHLREYKKSLIYEYVTGKKQVASADGNALPSA